MRTTQDASLLGRVFESQTGAGEEGRATAIDPMWIELRDAAASALESVAQALAAQGRADLAALRRIDARLSDRRANTGSAKDDDTALLLAAPLRWLLEDLRSLARIAAASAPEKPEASISASASKS